MIQTSAATARNRYPKLFEIASKELKETHKPNILSFGCSTGEEVLSIKEYIPNADIVGVDINHRSLAKAHKRDVSHQHEFFHYNNDEWQKENHYDCIMALAVFQRSEHREKGRIQSLSSFQFQQFSILISRLDKFLKKDGILILDNADYSFKDLELSKKYVVSEFDSLTDKPRPVFSKENIKTSSVSQINRVFKKVKDH
jgi:trans-aconitate methyltransferase